MNLLDSRYDGARQATYIALDFPTWTQAHAVVDAFGDIVDGYKVGLELFHGDGPTALKQLQDLGKRVFLDVKLHDIPNTVAGALRAVCREHIEMVNIHTTGGRKMMEAAREVVDGSLHKPLLIGVTALTSLSDADLREIQLPSSGDWVNHLAKIGKACGLDGVVASALDVANIRAWADSSFEVVVPGTRPAGAILNDQARSSTPGNALKLGASRLVLGRAVTQVPNRIASLQAIWDEMVDVLSKSDGGVRNAGTSFS
jgi:orotidine-5'-phosphate decarboxylase